MKKFLSLALALLMMLPLAIGASASGNSIVTVDEFKDILEYWQWANSGKDRYDDFLDYLSKYDKDYAREWKDTCGTCKHTAYYYISKGNVYYYCPKCDETVKVVDTDKCPGCGCTDCDTRYGCGCDDCKKCDCEIDPGFSVRPEEEFKSLFDHRYKSCDIDDVAFYDMGNKILWYCGNCYADGFIKKSDWNDRWDSYYWDYDISVYLSRGGTYDVNGILRADHGDKKTFTFTPDKGYVVYEVKVNGVDYGCPTKLTLTITEDTRIEVTFVKEITLKNSTFKTEVKGGGSVTAKVNGKTVDADKFTVKYGDTVTYKFTPASSNYLIKNVTVNGRSVGKPTTYTIDGGITKDHTVKVTYVWQNPYNDMDNETGDKYLSAVEYVTEAGIMGYYNKYINKNAFCGTKEITVKNFVSALAEMADTNNKLDSTDERVEWAIDNGLVDEDDDLSAVCKVQPACRIVYNFLCLLEDKADIDFENFDEDDSVKKNAIAIDLVSESTYQKNRTLTRYDLAAICSLLANLEIDD